MRGRHKDWRNGPGGKWTARIIWYEGEPTDIRLKLETPTGVINKFYKDQAEAQKVWDDFKAEWRDKTS